MYLGHCDKINPGDNVIVALGDSFTQGVGAYTLESWLGSEKWGKPHLFNLSGDKYMDQQAKYNWASQIRDNHLPDYKVWNLGINGTGNRGAVKELYLNSLPKDLGNVIVILMSTGVDRFDFLKNDYKTSGENNHQKWQTIWPIVGDRGPISVIEKVYAELLHSFRVTTTEYLLNVADAQSFCRARGYKFLFTSAFDTHIDKKLMTRELDRNPEYINIVDWNDYITLDDGNLSYMDMIAKLENNPKCQSFHQMHAYCSTLSEPLEYITPCAHWTIKGQGIVAQDLYKQMIKHNLL